ncbi:hypothetical protein F5146DRAFT_214920 [Armillaria mellea]|nr:hypothetical protein F5146DRAFT_214920 [Armillaria mellea]
MNSSWLLSPASPWQVSLRVARAQSNLRTFKSLALSMFMVVVVASFVMVCKQAFRSFYPLFSKSIPIPAPRPWRSSLPSSAGQVSLFTLIIMVLISFVLGFLARSVSFEKFFLVLDKLHPLFVDLCSCFGTMASCVIESAMSNIVDGRLGDGIRQGEVVIEDIPSPELGGNLEASINTASLSSGNVCKDVVQPLRTSVSIQAMPEVLEVKDISISTDPVSTRSIDVQCKLAPKESKDISIGTDPISKTSVGVQHEFSPEESKNGLAPGDSRGSLYATATEGNSSSQMMDNPEVVSVLTVNSDFNIYTMAKTMSFPPVDDLANITEFERLRQDIRGFDHESEADESMAPTLPVTELGVSPSTSTPASPRPVQPKALEYFRDRWGSDTKHLWAREFWYRVLRNEELIKVVYQTMLPDDAVTDEDKYEMELGIGLVRLSALRLSEHATNPILRLPYNVLPEDADGNDSVFVSAEANEMVASSSASIAHRSPSPFVRPSNPQSRFFESSSSEASVAAPTTQNGLPSPSRTPTAGRRRPALAQVTNTPRGVQTTPSRTPTKVRRGQGAQNGVPTPPPSLRPKLGKLASRFPLIAPTTRFKEESDSPTRPARRCPPSSKFPRWIG